MATKLETLQEKLAKLQADIEAETQRDAVEKATAEVRDSFSEAIKAAITITETDTGHSLRSIGLGVWVAYPKANPDGELMISALTVGDDGLPANLRRTPSKNGTPGNGHSNGNGNGNGYTYTLGDGREFETCEAAVNALGVATRDDKGDFLEGKQYYHRHDRLPKELKAKIAKAEKETPEAKAEPPEAETPETPATPEAKASK